MIDSRLLRPAAPGAPLVIAVFSYRYDAHLVPDFIENIRPFVHGYVAWDDRAATETLTSEPDRRNLLLAQARAMGARWILATDPDERIEAGLARRLPDLLAQGESNLWSFALREMFTPESYRTDGVWGRKLRIRLFPLRAVRLHRQKALHGAWVEAGGEFRVRDAETNFYHLRMATPERRRLRRELYAAADPERLQQDIGYDYLDDERGMVLEPIPKGREFTPAFHEDHGLWSPDPGMLGDLSPDPLETRLSYVARALGSCGQAQASHVLEDLAATHPADSDLLPAAALIAQMAGDMPRVHALASAVLARSTENALALYLRGKAAGALGDTTGLRADLARLQALVGDCLLVQDLSADLARPTEDFTAVDARWRRWVPGPAICREGAQISVAPMSVVVIGYRAPAELAAAVASLRAQDPPCEIVVVNSGGGAVESVLAAHLDHIRLISTRHRLYVGAARNIGIDASRGRLIGFLADDCQALPGWIAGRMRAHDQGAWFVSNPVVPEPGASRLATALVGMRYGRRNPTTRPDRVLHYGRSFRREALALAGYFPTGLRVSEDTALIAQLDRLAPCIWAPDVLTTHKEPAGILAMLREHFRRGIHKATNPPYRAVPGRKSRMGRHLSNLIDGLGLNQGSHGDNDNQRLREDRFAIAVGFATAIAQFLGLQRGLARQGKADRLLAQARRALAAAGDSAALLALFQRAVDLDPQDPVKVLALGRAHAQLGQDGAEAFRKALALDPTLPDPLAGLLAPLIAGQTWNAALATAEDAARTAPLVHQHWLAAAEVAAMAGRPALAIAYAQRALALAPALPAVHARLAALYQSLGNAPTAALRSDCADRLRAHAAHHGLT